jgi:hypothetical protein
LGGHVEVDEPATPVTEKEDGVERLEGRRLDDEEVSGRASAISGVQ